ncbi:hypothetical protein IFM89_003524 [Coptis chinensis]|uniref:Lipoxygenase domain-containing protein n=1 Tax=Coptis chinensis TaxID=261450 RepID=A0A835GTW6_9MAGN|nr:hypothetical protein IFM89_003524 [Coptis chinensis]
MGILNVLSSHSANEEYIGSQLESSWSENPVIKEAFERFSLKIKDMEVTVKRRNKNQKLSNRTGVGVLPYELLKPTSEAGVTGIGVPNSISI